jgi:hypothetical protein
VANEVRRVCAVETLDMVILLEEECATLRRRANHVACGHDGCPRNERRTLMCLRHDVLRLEVRR